MVLGVDAVVADQWVGQGIYRLTGTDLLDVTRVLFGSRTITAQWTSANDNWWATGAFRRVSDGVIYVYPPIGLAPGTYGVRATNRGGTSPSFNVKVLRTTTRTIYSNSNLTAGRTLTIAIAQATEPGTTTAILVVSPVRRASVAPGLVSLEIGNNFSAFEAVYGLGFNRTTNVIQLPVPTFAPWRGAIGYIEAIYFRNPLPLPTTNSWQIRLQ